MNKSLAYLKRFSLVFVFLSYSYVASAQEKPFVLGITEEIKSKELGENRKLNIYLPDGYDTSREKYPVIYLLDGSKDEDFIHVVGVVQFLTMIEAMPKTIVVGIANVDRKRDFTFPTSLDSDKKAYPTTGGSAKFMDFMESELVPYVEHKYRTSGAKTIIGQSLGGLVAVELFLKKPGLFNNYIIVSPSLWWDGESLLVKAPGLLPPVNKKASVFVSVGTEGAQMEGDAKKFVEVLEKYHSRYKVFFVPLPEEDHLTILHNAVYKALLALYKK